MAEEKKEVKTFAQIESEAAEQLNTFVFVIFVPNPNTRVLRIWIDGSEEETIMDVDHFLDIIERTCGYNARNKLNYACMEYGIAFIYDRQKDKLKELTELPKQEGIKISADYHKQYENETADPYSVNNFFNAALEATKGLNNFGLPDFSPKNIRF